MTETEWLEVCLKVAKEEVRRAARKHPTSEDELESVANEAIGTYWEEIYTNPNTQTPEALMRLRVRSRLQDYFIAEACHRRYYSRLTGRLTDPVLVLVQQEQGDTREDEDGGTILPDPGIEEGPAVIDNILWQQFCSSLTLRQAHVFELVYLEGYSTHEAAEILKINQSSVQRPLAAAETRLKVFLKRVASKFPVDPAGSAERERKGCSQKKDGRARK
jgi:RNA polymerase sigma factor (sigma-70 family)